MKELAKQHNIALYSAKMVMKGKWTLDYALSLEKPVFNQGVRWLLYAKRKKWTMAFRTFERGVVFGKVLKVRKYNTLLLTRGRLRYLEKIETAYVFNSKNQGVLPEYIRRDPFVSDVKEKPAYKPSDRKIPDLAAIKERAAVKITLYSGEIMEGLVTWVTEFDFELKMDRYITVLIYKHAVLDATEKEFHRFRQPFQKKEAPRPFNRPKPGGPPRPRFQGTPPPGRFGPSSGGGFGPR